jgi:hypothetical protein
MITSLTLTQTIIILITAGFIIVATPSRLSLSLGFIIVATPYRLDMDYLRSCDLILAKFDAVAVELASQYGPLPVCCLSLSLSLSFSLFLSRSLWLSL